MSIESAVAREIEEKRIAKIFAEALNKWYPGHLWGVTVNLEGGIANVLNLALSGRYGFVIHLSKVMYDQKSLFYAGGEILERYRLSRGKMVTNEMADLKRDFAGSTIGEIK